VLEVSDHASGQTGVILRQLALSTLH